MPSNNVFQYSKIRTRKRSAKKIIKPEKNGIHLFLESGIHCAGIRNPVPGIRNPQHGIQNPRLSWIPLHGAKPLISKGPSLTVTLTFHMEPVKYGFDTRYADITLYVVTLRHIPWGGFP